MGPKSEAYGGLWLDVLNLSFEFVLQEFDKMVHVFVVFLNKFSGSREMMDPRSALRFRPFQVFLQFTKHSQILQLFTERILATTFVGLLLRV